ncbi:MAG: YkgJ family cysteine cluster protein [Bacteroidota bacterium]|nr:YkgJ family cysteine cluster protein [Bacteroidota bacterium]
MDLFQENKVFFARLKKKKPKNLDIIAQKLHDEIFQKIDCLDCANCCKSISPTLYDKDINRLAKHLKIKPSQFVEKYLYLDEEGDYVFKETPCPFLLNDNYCMVYESRPKACREYPHTDRPRFYQVLNLTLKNSLICPAVFELIERLKQRKNEF